MTGHGESPSPGARGKGRILLIATVVLIVAAAAALVVGSDDARLLRLGVVAALWAALIGAFAAARMRSDVLGGAEEAEQLRRIYQLELEREVAARHEHELQLERDLRAQARDDERAELEALRGEMRGMREHLESLFGGELLVERVALRAESTRLRALGDQPRSRAESRALPVAPRPGRQLTVAGGRDSTTVDDDDPGLTVEAGATPVPTSATVVNSAATTRLTRGVDERRVDERRVDDRRADDRRTGADRRVGEDRRQVDDQWTGDDRRSGDERRTTERRSADRRSTDQRTGERRPTEVSAGASNGLPRRDPTVRDTPDRRPRPADQVVASTPTTQLRSPAEADRPARPASNGAARRAPAVPRTPARPAELPTEVHPVVAATPAPPVTRKEPQDPLFGAVPTRADAGWTPSWESTPSWEAEPERGGRRRAPEPQQGGRRAAVEPPAVVDAPTGGGGRRARREQSEQPPATPAGRRARPDDVPAATPARSGGRRAKPDPVQSTSYDPLGPVAGDHSGVGFTPVTTPTSTHAASNGDRAEPGGRRRAPDAAEGGRSVEELLAAYGNESAARRGRHRDVG